MKAFVKYCGGCNPSFNRGEYVKELLEKAGLEKVGKLEVAELVILVQGCKSSCATIKTKENQRRVTIDGSKPPDQLAEEVNNNREQ